MHSSAKRRLRRLIATLVVGILFAIGGIALEHTQPQPPSPKQSAPAPHSSSKKAHEVLEDLAVKGRAPKTGYSREQFGNGWADWRSCDTRNKILARDLKNIRYRDKTCTVDSGTLHDPYTGKIIEFSRGPRSSQDVQIDHVVALADAWQKGAQGLHFQKRHAFANDDLNLLAVDGHSNMQKGAGDAATWLPKQKAFRCQYIARQIAVKAKYMLWVTPSEKAAMLNVLSSCPEQTIPA